MSYSINMQRAYSPASPEDGTRFLVDRLWPRGIKKESLPLTAWPKAVTPSTQLRRAWHAKELDFTAFKQAYLLELNSQEEALLPLLKAARQGKVTLVSAVKNLDISHVPVLRDKLLSYLHHEDLEVNSNEPTSAPCYGHEFPSY